MFTAATEHMAIPDFSTERLKTAKQSAISHHFFESYLFNRLWSFSFSSL